MPKPAVLTASSANLDLLRSVAVLSVLVNHVVMLYCRYQEGRLTWAWDLGRLGVLLFFVHTSLVLMLSLERSAVGDWRHQAGIFYIRRAFRIYPLSVVCVLTCVLFRIPVMPLAPPANVSTGTVLANLLLVQNLFARPSVTGPLWSLPLEVQMYLTLPFLYFFATRRGAKGVAWAGVGSALLAALYLYLEPRVVGFGLSRLAILNYVPCFLAGIFSYALSKKSRFAAPSWAWPLLVLAVVGIYLGWQWMNPLPLSNRDSPYRAWAICWFTGCSIPHFAELQSRWLRAAARTVAKYSYGIYLGHSIVFWIGFDVCSHLPFASRCLIAAAGLVAVPYAAFHIIENPSIGWGKRIAARWGGSRCRASAPVMAGRETSQ